MEGESLAKRRSRAGYINRVEGVRASKALEVFFRKYVPDSEKAQEGQQTQLTH